MSEELVLSPAHNLSPGKVCQLDEGLPEIEMSKIESELKDP